MNESNERRDLGMDRRIPRRDFLNGVAVAFGGAYAASRIAPLGADGFEKAPQAGATAAADYPPALTGLRGNYPEALGANQRVLVLDNHDDFGGHAKRNEFTYQGRTFIGYGGTQSIATPYPYSYTAKRLIEELGVEVERNGEFANRG